MGEEDDDSQHNRVNFRACAELYLYREYTPYVTPNVAACEELVYWYPQKAYLSRLCLGSSLEAVFSFSGNFFFVFTVYFLHLPSSPRPLRIATS